MHIWGILASGIHLLKQSIRWGCNRNTKLSGLKDLPDSQEHMVMICWQAAFCASMRYVSDCYDGDHFCEELTI